MYIFKLILYYLFKFITYLAAAGAVVSFIILPFDTDNSEVWISGATISFSIMAVFLLLGVWRRVKLPLPGKDYI